MLRPQRCLAIIVVGFGGSLLKASLGLTAPTADFSEPTPSAPRRDERIPPGTLDSRALLRSALAADAAIDPQRLQRAMQRAMTHLSHCRAQLAAETSELERARLVFHYLRHELLTGEFDPRCGRLQDTLESGVHNCLTATILYLTCCREVGLRAAAVASPAHVQVALDADRVTYRIETTHDVWAPQPLARSVAHTSTIADQALIGRVYYNLGIVYAEQQQYAIAAQLTRAGWQMDPSHAPARANLLAILHNWCLDLVSDGQLDAADKVLRAGLTIDADYLPLRRCEEYLRQTAQSGTVAKPQPQAASNATR
jgi:hypothetical protein